MSNCSDLDGVRRSTLATVDEIRTREMIMRARGVDVTDEGEWLELRDIVARIERRLAANLKATASDVKPEGQSQSTCNCMELN